MEQKNFLEKFIEKIEERGGWSTEELKGILLKLLAQENKDDTNRIPK